MTQILYAHMNKKKLVIKKKETVIETGIGVMVKGDFSFIFILK
jgi:hypothetical protein